MHTVLPAAPRCLFVTYATPGTVLGGTTRKYGALMNYDELDAQARRRIEWNMRGMVS